MLRFKTQKKKNWKFKKIHLLTNLRKVFKVVKKVLVIAL